MASESQPFNHWRKLAIASLATATLYIAAVAVRYGGFTTSEVVLTLACFACAGLLGWFVLLVGKLRFELASPATHIALFLALGWTAWGLWILLKTVSPSAEGKYRFQWIDIWLNVFSRQGLMISGIFMLGGLISFWLHRRERWIGSNYPTKLSIVQRIFYILSIVIAGLSLLDLCIRIVLGALGHGANLH